MPSQIRGRSYSESESVRGGCSIRGRHRTYRRYIYKSPLIGLFLYDVQMEGISQVEECRKYTECHPCDRDNFYTRKLQRRQLDYDGCRFLFLLQGRGRAKELPKISHWFRILSKSGAKNPGPFITFPFSALIGVPSSPNLLMLEACTSVKHSSRSIPNV